MNTPWITATLAWIEQHPALAGFVIFAIAFSDAVIILGAIVPALPLLFAVGLLIGLDKINGLYAVACASLGAFAGDALSFWIGYRWGTYRLREIWPFNRYPQLLHRGESLFRGNAFKSILVARYVGAVRPFVPAIAGMLRMPLKHYTFASGLACLSWGAPVPGARLATRRSLRRSGSRRRTAPSGHRITPAGPRSGLGSGVIQLPLGSQES